MADERLPCSQSVSMRAIKSGQRHPPARGYILHGLIEWFFKADARLVSPRTMERLTMDDFMALVP